MNTPEILYLHGGALVCVKPAGLLSEDAADASMPRLLGEYLAGQGISDKIMTVHRLDRAVGGLMVYALGAGPAVALTAQFCGGGVTKEYLAIVHGRPENEHGELVDLLYHDQKKNKTYVVGRERRGVREARLEYWLAGSSGDGGDRLSLLRVRLLTGRTHQIRAQFSSRGLPLWGDSRYGSPVRGGGENIALWSVRLAFSDPASGERIDLKKAPPDSEPWRAFDGLMDMIYG